MLEPTGTPAVPVARFPEPSSATATATADTAPEAPPTPVPAKMSGGEVSRDRRSSDAADPAYWTQRPLALELHLGAATPTGRAGVRVDLGLSRFVALNAGIGSGYAGVQYAALLRFRWPLREPFGAHALGLEAGWSAGPFAPLGCENDLRCQSWEFAHWANAAAVYEYRSLGGFVFRAYTGGGFVLNENDCLSEEECVGLALPYVGIALGYAIAL